MIQKYHQHWRAGAPVIPTSPGWRGCVATGWAPTHSRIPDREGAVCHRGLGVPEELNVVAVVLF